MTMRQIKFRAKDTFKSEFFPQRWLYGTPVQDGDDIWLCVKKEDKGIVSVKVDPSTIGQFTGVTDCHGKEIYEGDIIKVDELAMPCEVIWYDKTASFQLRYHVEGGFNIPKDALGLWVQDYKSVITVVGNIHDNPELIK